MLAPLGAAQGPAPTATSPIQRAYFEKGPTNPAFVIQNATVPLFAAGGGQQGLSGSLNSSLLWRHESDGSWIAESASLGNHGTEVFVEYGDFDNRAALLSGHASNADTPIWQVDQVHLNVRRRVDSSEFTSVHVSAHLLYDEVADTWQTQLRKFSLGSTVADWQFDSSIVSLSPEYLDVAVSDDGQRIVLIEWDPAANGSRVSLFGPDSAVPVAVHAVPSFGGVRRFQLSEDGSTLLLVSNQKVTLVDVASGAVVYEDYLFGIAEYFSFAISGDGAVLGYSKMGSIRTYHRNEVGVYEQGPVHSPGQGHYARAMDLSMDGGVLFAGLQKLGNLNAVRFKAIDTATGTVLLDHELEGSGALSNLIESVECSSDGTRFAAGLWGDADGVAPEVLAFEVGEAGPILAEDLPGSVYSISLSPDGRHLAVASKGVHSSVWGGGGAFSLYRVGQPELEVDGLPLADTVVQLRQHLREGLQGRILVATQLAATPTAAPQYGDGLLYLDPASVVELPIQTGATDNFALTPYLLGAAGSEIYLQAVHVDRGQLGRSWIKVTVAP